MGTAEQGYSHILKYKALLPCISDKNILLVIIKVKRLHSFYDISHILNVIAQPLVAVNVHEKVPL